MQSLQPYTKLAFIFLLMLLLLMPQNSMINLIKERVHWQTSAMENIKQSWPGEQTLAGPFLRIPFTVETSGKERAYVKTLMPSSLKINTQLQTSERYRGIHKIPVYQTTVHVSGTFTNDELWADIQKEFQGKELIFGQSSLEYYVSDQRGIQSQPSLNWGEEKANFQANENRNLGISAAIQTNVGTVKDYTFRFDLALNGLQAIKFAQIAEQTQIQLNANWQHPNFIGDFLPSSREISDEGFSASWQSTAISNQAKHLLDHYVNGNVKELTNNSVGVSLNQPVDHYSLSERSVKYAQLFVILTFVAMILFEILKKLRIHPVQYLLIGLELMVFYLLLVSLSEHLRFGSAYIIAAIASTSLLTLYFMAILKSKKTGAIFGAGLLSLYATLFVILQAESHALLMGSLLLFLVLAALMLSTRHLDWYALMDSYMPKKQINTEMKET